MSQTASGSGARSFPDSVIISGGKAVVTGSKTIDVEPLACMDSNQNVNILTKNKIVVDISTNGLNGLDTGTVAVSTDYFLYIIKSSKGFNDFPIGFVFSLSSIAPTFPPSSNIGSYDLFRQVGKFMTSSAGNIEMVDQLLAIKGIVDTWGDLPVTPDSVLDLFIVRTATGIWLINRKPAGLYKWDIGSSSWTHMSAFPNQHNTANFELFDNADNTKRLKFNLLALATSTIRNIIMPDKDVEVDDKNDGRIPKDYQPAVSVARSTTTLNTFQIKTTLTTPVLTGTYLVKSTGLIDDDKSLSEYRLRNITDSLNAGGLIIAKYSNTPDRRPYILEDEVVFTGAAKTFEMQFKNVAGGGITGISNARITIRRVSL